MKKRLAIITTHPIQYHAPLFELISRRGIIDIRVFYTWGESVLESKYDPGFDKIINWDIDLLNGYDYIFLENIAFDKGSHHFHGINNPNILTEIKKFEPDGILVFGWAFKSHLSVMRHFRHKIPIYFRGDSNLIDPISLFRRWARTLSLRWVYKFVDIAFYVGKNNYQYFLKAGLEKNQLVYAPHAVDNVRFSCWEEECKKKADDLKKQLKIKKDDLVFLFAGKLERKKDPELLLQAFMNTTDSHDVRLIIVGNGPLENSLKEKFGMDARISFIDFQNQSVMPSVYKVADIFILPSRGPGETWGLAVNEAMASGKAIIVSDRTGCAPDLVEGKGTGFVFKAGNSQMLQEIMQRLNSNRTQIYHMQQRSLEVIKGFTFEKDAEVIERTLVENKRKI